MTRRAERRRRIAAHRKFLASLRRDRHAPLPADDIRRAGVDLRLPAHLKHPISPNPLGSYENPIA